MISCRSCGNTDLLSILSLGKMPLANALLTQRQLTVPDTDHRNCFARKTIPRVFVFFIVFGYGLE